MNILAAGCSFAHNPKFALSWPDYLGQKGHTVNNLGLLSACNSYIANSVIVELLTTEMLYDYVLVMWTGLLRRGFWLDTQVANMYPESNFRKRTVIGNVDFATGGATLDRCHDAVRSSKKAQDLIMTDETKAVLSVLEIIKLQEFLKSKKINYRFMTYANYWNDTTNTSGSLSSINNYKSVQVLSEGLDFNQFIFYNNQRDGLYEFAKATNQICDGFHPTSIAAENWSQIIIDNLGI